MQKKTIFSIFLIICQNNESGELKQFAYLCVCVLVSFVNKVNILKFE